MQKPSRDKGFQRERDICLHFAHCPQLSNRFVFVFARVRPPRTRRRGARSNLGHCHPRHILGARQRGLQKAAERLRERRPRRALATRGRPGRGGRSCARGGRAPALRSRRGGGQTWTPAAAFSVPRSPGKAQFRRFSGVDEHQVANLPPPPTPPKIQNWKEGRGCGEDFSSPAPDRRCLPGKVQFQPHASWEPAACPRNTPLRHPKGLSAEKKTPQRNQQHLPPCDPLLRRFGVLAPLETAPAPRHPSPLSAPAGGCRGRHNRGQGGRGAVCPFLHTEGAARGPGGGGAGADRGSGKTSQLPLPPPLPGRPHSAKRTVLSCSAARSWRGRGEAGRRK